MEVVVGDIVKRSRSPHERNALKLRDTPEVHGKWVIMAKYDNPNSAGHQAWRLNHRIFGPEGTNPNEHFSFCSKWLEDEYGTTRYCLLGKYEP